MSWVLWVMSLSICFLLSRCFLLVAMGDLMGWNHISCPIENRSIGDDPVWDGRVDGSRSF